MAIESKYGRVTIECGDIPEDEPVFLFRAQDQLLPDILAYYAARCRSAGSPAHHIDGVDASRAEILEWQRTHTTQVPQSAGVRAATQ